MKPLSFIKHPEYFQGENCISQVTNYFEGWYFKLSNGIHSIAFIPGINIQNGNYSAFIQVITKENSYFISFPFSDFSFSHNPFSIQIGKNYFSLHQLKLEIEDRKSGLNLQADFKLTHTQKISSNCFAPNIMGPFSYLSSMECNHAILSMNSQVTGHLVLNNNLIPFHHGIGYIEKDWGTSFPKSYIWCQANEFSTPANFMLSVAEIPLGSIRFTGMIGVLSFSNHEYKFATYYGAKIQKYEVSSESIRIEIKQGSKLLTIRSQSQDSLSLLAPTKGKMDKEILESICSQIHVTLQENTTIIFSSSSNHAGLEIVI